jgi:DNA-directed RNA polymerase subunit F
MSNSQKASNLQKIKQASSRPQPLTEQERDHQSLLEHLQKLVKADPKAAREALEMSQEQAPELLQIAQNQPPNQWAEALMSSDSMRSLLSLSPSQAKALLAQPDLRSLLELMP